RGIPDPAVHRLPEQGPPQGGPAPRMRAGEGLMATKPPVTLQEDWATTLQPWLDRVSPPLDVECVHLGVDPDHVLTGVVRGGLHRSLAPISALLVGAAVARGASLEGACTAVEAVTAAARCAVDQGKLC